MKLLICLFLTLLSSSAIISAAPEPPKLIAASPPLWGVNVDPTKQKAIALTFDQAMSPGFSAWLGRSSLTPEVNLNSTVSDDRRTFEMKVSLQPGRVYVFGLNEKGIPGVGFQNDKGLSLPAHFLVFATAGGMKVEDAPPRVVRTVPGNGTQQLDSIRMKSIAITFDRPMSTKKHGLRLFENNELVDLSKAQFAYSPDGLTFMLPYSFKPTTPYRLELNSVYEIGFTRTNRVPLWPMRITFSTR